MIPSKITYNFCHFPEMGCCESNQQQLLQCHTYHTINTSYEEANISLSQFITGKTTSIFFEYKFMAYISRNSSTYLRKVQHLKSSFGRVAKVFYRTKRNEKLALN